MTTTPIQPSTEYTQYLWLSLVALCGSIARAGKWVDANGKFMPSKLVTEMASAIVFGVLATAIGTYFHLDPKIIGGLAGAMGLMGAAAVIGTIQNFVSARFGGQANAGDKKP